MTMEGYFDEINISPKEKLNNLFEKNEITNIHKFIETEFSDYFEKRGYEKSPSVGLISKEDESVLFTGSSINAIKSILLSGDYPEGKKGVYVNQECLRTQALKEAFSNDYIPFGQTYFHMSTILSRPGRFKDVVLEALDFTDNRLNSDLSKILIRSTKTNNELADVDSYVGVKVDFDSQKDSYYRWKYGVPGVRGEGLTISMFNSGDGKYWDVGNIVKIMDDKNRELGIEFGYGYEFLLSSLMGVGDPLKMSQIFELYEFKDGLPKKYYSYLEATVRMKIADIKIGHHREEHVYKQYLKLLQSIGQTLGKSVEEIILEMRRFSNFIEIPGLNLESEKKFMEHHLSRKLEVKNIVKRVGKFLWAEEHNRKPKEIIHNPWSMVDNYLVQNGIDRLEVENELERLDRFKKTKR